MGPPPAWCQSRRGTSAGLVVAPHGGMSPDPLLSAAAAGRRANDLHTASLARELAEKLGAASLINDAEDRNRLDLNRVRDVVDRAPWFLRELEALLDGILADHDTAVVLFVHGWHVEQAWCDLGVGARLGGPSEARERSDRLSASAEFVEGPLETFRRELEGRGIVATYGARWPAAHKNNVMRLFRRRPADEPPAPRLEEWVRRGRVEAVQLELGAPLRWPGRARDLFVEAVAHAFGESHPPRREKVRSLPLPTRPAPTPTRALSLQLFDPGWGPDGLGLIAGAMHLPGGAVGARLQLFPGAQQMGIFTGHGLPGAVLGVPNLHFEEHRGGFVLRFDGHVLRAEDGASFFLHEAHRADAELCEASVRLSYLETGGGFGRARGEVAFGARVHGIDAPAFAGLRLAGPGSGRGLRLFVAFDGAPPIRVLQLESPGAWRTDRLEGDAWLETKRAGRRIDHSGDTWLVEFDEHEPLVVRERTRVALLRPMGPGGYVHATVGVAHVTLGTLSGTGFYEERRPL